MQLEDKTGIRCDGCGSIHRSVFTYYSLDFRSVSVIANRRPALQQILSQDVKHSIDLCEGCYHGITEAVKRNYRPVTVGICCDLSGQHLLQTFDYYHCCVSKVAVDLSQQGVVCKRCSKPATGPQCSCGSSEFVKAASMDVSERLLELDVSGVECQKLVDRAKLIKEQASEWSVDTP